MTGKNYHPVAFISCKPDKTVIQELLMVENLMIEEIRCKGIVDLAGYIKRIKRRYEVVILSTECACSEISSVVTLIKLKWDASVIIITSQDFPGLEKEARNAGVLCYLTSSEKQFLHEVINKTIEYQNTRIGLQ